MFVIQPNEADLSGWDLIRQKKEIFLSPFQYWTWKEIFLSANGLVAKETYTKNKNSPICFWNTDKMNEA